MLSFPGPDRSIKLEDLAVGRAVSRRYRNRRIGDFFKELDLTEGRSTGIPKILRAMHHNGSQVPQFETDEDRSYFLIRLPGRRGAQLELPFEDSLGPTGAQSGAQSHAVLRALAANPLSSNEISQALGLKTKSGALKRTLQALLHEGLVEYTLPDKLTSRLQKYRLTAAGRAGLRRHRRRRTPRSSRQVSHHPTTAASTESTRGRCPATVVQRSPASAEPYTCPPVVPK